MGWLYPMFAYFMDRLIRITKSDLSKVCLKVEVFISCIKTQKSIRNLWSATKIFELQTWKI